jgi:hypothetical protein
LGMAALVLLVLNGIQFMQVAQLSENIQEMAGGVNTASLTGGGGGGTIPGANTPSPTANAAQPGMVGGC